MTLWGADADTPILDSRPGASTRRWTSSKSDKAAAAAGGGDATPDQGDNTWHPLVNNSTGKTRYYNPLTKEWRGAQPEAPTASTAPAPHPEQQDPKPNFNSFALSWRTSLAQVVDCARVYFRAMSCFDLCDAKLFRRYWFF